MVSGPLKWRGSHGSMLSGFVRWFATDIARSRELVAICTSHSPKLSCSETTVRRFSISSRAPIIFVYSRADTRQLFR